MLATSSNSNRYFLWSCLFSFSNVSFRSFFSKKFVQLHLLLPIFFFSCLCLVLLISGASAYSSLFSVIAAIPFFFQIGLSPLFWSCSTPNHFGVGHPQGTQKNVTVPRYCPQSLSPVTVPTMGNPLIFYFILKYSEANGVYSHFLGGLESMSYQFTLTLNSPFPYFLTSVLGGMSPHSTSFFPSKAGCLHSLSLCQGLSGPHSTRYPPGHATPVHWAVNSPGMYSNRWVWKSRQCFAPKRVMVVDK